MISASSDSNNNKATTISTLLAAAPNSTVLKRSRPGTIPVGTLPTATESSNGSPADLIVDGSSPHSSTQSSSIRSRLRLRCCQSRFLDDGHSPSSNSQSRDSHGSPTTNNTTTNKRSSSSSSSSSEDLPSQTVYRIRLLFWCSLVVVALLLGIFTYRFVSQSELDLAEQQWEALADRILDLGEELAVRRRVVVKSVGQIASSAFPYAQDWPNVAIPAFNQIAKDLSSSSGNMEVSFHPLVIPESLNDTQQASFEQFAYDYYYNVRDFPNDTAYHSFGRGVWKMDHVRGGSVDLVVRDTTGQSMQRVSDERVLLPMLQNSQDDNLEGRTHLMLNVHSMQSKGEPLDEVIRCARERKLKQADTDCGVVTKILQWNRDSYLVQPIYPANDPWTFTGVIMASVSWDTTIEKMFEGSLATGLTAVLSSEGRDFSYTVKDGVATFSGEGDFHSPHYDDYRRSVLLAGNDLSGFSDRHYTLSLYPSEDFFRMYSTDNPRFATMGAVLIVIITSFIFFVYDLAVRREFIAKQQLLQAKRHFMRFVSHEVRTPLNAVCLGLSLLQDEIRQTFDHNKNEDSHNKQTPLFSTPIDNKLEKLETHMQEWLVLTQEICDSAESSVAVLNDLLNYDKIQMGNFTLELTVFPILSLIQHVFKEFRLSAKKKSIAFELNCDHLLGPSQCLLDVEDGGVLANVNDFQVVGDTIRLTQVLRNLVSNALKFTPEGGKLLIKLKSESASKKGKIDQYKLKSGEQVAFKRNRMLRIEVIDTGVGMTESQIASLCQDGAQFNANELQAGQGSGLGLFISKGMVMQHGGALFAASKGLGCGSTFVVTLPFYCSSDTKSNQSSEVGVSDPKPPRRLNSDTTTAGTSSSHLFSISTPSEIAPGLSITHIAASPSPPTSSQPNIEKPMPDSGEGTASVSLRILVVDDVASNRKLIARMARNKKHFVDEANHGKEAVDKAIKATEDGRPFDVILMDNEMPVMTGADAVKKIRELGCADPFIIGVTGNVLAEDVNHFLDCGANSVLPKPVKFPKLEELWIENGIFGLKA